MGMATYWYVSTDKLQALGATSAGLPGRLRTTLKVGLGGTGMEIGVDAAAARSLDRAVGKAEKQLHRKGDISDVAAFASGPPAAVYFRCHGPACRAVVAGMFWAALVANEVAVLLVGSASNAVAAKHYGPDEVFSPSADPVGAVRHLLRGIAPEMLAADDRMHRPSHWQGYEGPEAQADTLGYAWNALLRRDLDLVGEDIDALPMAVSVAQYVARYRFNDARHDWRADVNWIVLGTPIYVSQTSKIIN